MPHIHLETTADLPENADVPDILDALAATLSAQESVKPETVKAYHTLRSHWAVGTGAPEGFAHCTLGLLSGRPVELRRTIAEAAMATLREAFAASLEAGEVSLTLEVREMDAATYLRA